VVISFKLRSQDAALYCILSIEIEENMS